MACRFVGRRAIQPRTPYQDSGNRFTLVKFLIILRQHIDLRMSVSAIPLINHNVESNTPLFTSCTTVQGQVLDWEDESAVEKDLLPSGIDLVM